MSFIFFGAVMIINKNTWHYRLWKLTYRSEYDYSPETTNLCDYCQRIFWLIVNRVCMVLLLIAGIGITPCGIGYAIYLHPWYTLCVIGAFTLIIGITAGFIAWREWLDRQAQRQPGLIRQWLRAKKQRACPMVEFR